MSGVMRLLSWKCQRFGNPWTSQSLRKIVREQVPTICFLMETRLDKEGFEKLYGNLSFQNKIIVKQLDSGGGLAFLWKNEVRLEVINFIVNHVLAKVTEEDGYVWYLTDFLWVVECTTERKLMETLKIFTNLYSGTIGDDWRF